MVVFSSDKEWHAWKDGLEKKGLKDLTSNNELYIFLIHSYFFFIRLKSRKGDACTHVSFLRVTDECNAKSAK